MTYAAAPQPVMYEQPMQYAPQQVQYEAPVQYAAPPTTVYEQPQAVTYAAPPTTYAAPEPVQYFQPQPTMMEQPQFVQQPVQYAPQPALPSVGSMIAVPQYQFTPQQPGTAPAMAAPQQAAAPAAPAAPAAAPPAPKPTRRGQLRRKRGRDAASVIKFLS